MSVPVMAASAVKALDQPGRIGGYLVVWGSAEARDLHGEYFTPRTALGLDWYDRRPVLFQHGQDGAVKASVIGVIDHLQADEVGLWAEAQLDLRESYVRAIRDLIDKGALHWSSGSLAHLVEVEADGHITRWPIVEGSLTPTPAEPRRTELHIVKSAFQRLGLDPEPLQNPEDEKTEELVPVNDTPAIKRLPTEDREPGMPGPRIVAHSPYDNLSSDDLLHGYMLLRGSRGFRGVSQRYAVAMADKARRSGLSAIKADELSHSAQSGYGDEWVADLWSAQLWERARAETVILPLFPAVEMPSNPFEMPTESADPTVYYVPETTNSAQLSYGVDNPVPASKFGSSKVTLSAKKLALRAGFSSELVEDSIVPLLSIYRAQAARAIAEAIDNLLLNGDTASSGNINSSTTPAGGEVWLAFDGLRKQALGAGGLKTDMGNVDPTLEKLRQARFALPIQRAARPSDLAWIVDGKTYARLLKMSEFLTMDKAGPQATAQTGQIGFVDGIAVFMSASMPETAATGLVAGSGNTQGTALCVYRPGWMVGYRRAISVHADYIPAYDSHQLTATVRLAFAPQTTQMSSALVNIKVT